MGLQLTLFCVIHFFLNSRWLEVFDLDSNATQRQLKWSGLVHCTLYPGKYPEVIYNRVCLLLVWHLWLLPVTPDAPHKGNCLATGGRALNPESPRHNTNTCAALLVSTLSFLFVNFGNKPLSQRRTLKNLFWDGLCKRCQINYRQQPQEVRWSVKASRLSLCCWMVSIKDFRCSVFKHCMMKDFVFLHCASLILITDLATLHIYFYYYDSYTNFCTVIQFTHFCCQKSSVKTWYYLVWLCFCEICIQIDHTNLNDCTYIYKMVDGKETFLLELGDFFTWWTSWDIHYIYDPCPFLYEYSLCLKSWAKCLTFNLFWVQTFPSTGWIVLLLCAFRTESASYFAWWSFSIRFVVKVGTKNAQTCKIRI